MLAFRLAATFGCVATGASRCSSSCHVSPMPAQHTCRYSSSWAELVRPPDARMPQPSNNGWRVQHERISGSGPMQLCSHCEAHQSCPQPACWAPASGTGGRGVRGRTLVQALARGDAHGVALGRPVSVRVVLGAGGEHDLQPEPGRVVHWHPGSHSLHEALEGTMWQTRPGVVHRQHAITASRPRAWLLQGGKRRLSEGMCNACGTPQSIGRGALLVLIHAEHDVGHVVQLGGIVQPLRGLRAQQGVCLRLSCCRIWASTAPVSCSDAGRCTGPLTNGVYL